MRAAIYNRDQKFTYNGVEQKGSKVDAFLAKFWEDDEMKLKAYLLLNNLGEIKKTAEKKAKVSIEKDLLKRAQTRTVRAAKKEKEDEDTGWTPTIQSKY